MTQTQATGRHLGKKLGINWKLPYGINWEGNNKRKSEINGQKLLEETRNRMEGAGTEFEKNWESTEKEIAFFDGSPPEVSFHDPYRTQK